MNEKRLRRLLLVEAAVCALSAAALRFWPLAVGDSEFLTPVLSALLGAGRFGFAAGMTLSALVVLLPLYALLRIRTRRVLEREDALLPCVSLATAVTLWYGCSGGAKSTMGYVTWLGLALALAAAYLVLRLLRRFQEGGTGELLAELRLLLCCAAACFVFAAAFSELSSLLSKLSALSGSWLSASVVFSALILMLRTLSEALPLICAARTVLYALPLLDSLAPGKLTDEAARCAHALAAWCRVALRRCVLVTLSVNAVQALLFGLLTDIGIRVDVPVFELCFVLLALLGARLVETAAQLQAESDLIV